MMSLKLGSCCNVAAGFETKTSRWSNKPLKERRLQSPWKTTMPSTQRQRRFLMLLAASVFTNAFGDVLRFHCARAEENKMEDKEEGLLGGVLSLLDPNEKTKSGKVLPKSYLKSAREVVKNLRESLKEDVSNIAKFRRSADSAKESIKEFMQNWTGQKSVLSEIVLDALTQEHAQHCLNKVFHQRIHIRHL